MRVVLLILLLIYSLPAQAADYLVSNEDIWPSQNDVAQTAGNGKKLLENQWAKVSTGAFSINNYSLSGLTVPATSASLNIDVALGAAYLAGRSISIPGATTVTATLNATNYIFLKLSRDGANLATGVVLEVNTTGTAPADSTPIATLTAGAATITATVDKRIMPSQPYESWAANGTWTAPAGIYLVKIMAYGAGGGEGGAGGVCTGGGAGTDGSAGGTGGTTSFGAVVSVNGGIGGSGGIGQPVSGGGCGPYVTGDAAGGAHGSTATGAITLTGKGMMGNVNSTNGGNGGNGAYAESFYATTPGSTIIVTIGAGGTGGAGGTNGGGGTAATGAAGSAGKIILQYY